MNSLTENEARVIDFLIRNSQERTSINGIAKRLKITPNGAYKILKKLEVADAIIPEKIGNAIYYKANLDEEIGSKLSSYVLVQNDLNSYSKAWADDLKQLKDVALSVVLFGSILSKGREAKDVDVFVFLEQKNLKKVQSILKDIGSIRPKKIHAVFQTMEDLVRNIKKKDDVVLEVIKSGKILWGSEIIVGAIKNGASR